MPSGVWGLGCPADVPSSRRHLPAVGPAVPVHFFAAASILARSSGLSSDSRSSSSGSPLPAVLATRCHFRPSILSTGTPSPLTRTRARRFCAIGEFCRAALRSSATAATWFGGVPGVLRQRVAVEIEQRQIVGRLGVAELGRGSQQLDGLVAIGWAAAAGQPHHGQREHALAVAGIGRTLVPLCRLRIVALDA